MNLTNELSNIDESLFFQQALTRLHIDISNFVMHSGLEVYYNSDNKYSLETPFYFDSLYMPDEWIEKHLNPEDLTVLRRLNIISDNWYVSLYRKGENPNGVHLTFTYTSAAFMVSVGVDENAVLLSFLMDYGDETIQQKYRLAALFSEGEIDLTGMNTDLKKDINLIGKQLMQELSDKLTELLTPIRKQIEARIELFQQEIKQLY